VRLRSFKLSLLQPLQKFLPRSWTWTSSSPQPLQKFLPSSWTWTWTSPSLQSSKFPFSTCQALLQLQLLMP
jgi:hypothetical protein